MATASEPTEKPFCDGQITQDKFGTTHDGEEVTRYTLKNKRGMILQVIDYGATITSIQLPLKCGLHDVVLGFDDVKGYLAEKNSYFGSTVGRVTSRTKPTKFELNGKCVALTVNTGLDTHLHGGCKGFAKVLWTTEINAGQLIMKYKSRDGEEGYPGNLTVIASFAITEQNEVSINYTATTDDLTIINLTNHAYFNLAGHCAGPEALMDHEFTIESDNITELCDLVATGKILPVKNTRNDFRESKELNEAMAENKEEGYDVNFCLRPPFTCLKSVAKVRYRPKCITLEVLSNSECLQFYTANHLDNVPGKDKSTYNKFAGFCLECQSYPNAANIKSFTSIELKPNETYQRDIVFKFRYPAGK